MGFLDPLEARDVKDANTFIKWAQCQLGAPPVSVADIKVLNKKARVLFDDVPGTDWTTIVQVAQWCRARKKRVPRMWQYVEQYRYAWAAGAINLSTVDDIDAEILEAISQETDRAWKTRLRRATGNEAKREVLEEWRRKGR